MKIYLLGTVLTGALALATGVASASDSRVRFNVHIGVPIYQAPVYLHPHVVYEPRVVYHPHGNYYQGGHHQYYGHAPHNGHHFKNHHGQHRPHYYGNTGHRQVRDFPLHSSGGYAGSVRGGYR